MIEKDKLSLKGFKRSINLKKIKVERKWKEIGKK
jgi:hypothetical protein